MKVFSTDVLLFATLYVVADNEDEAARIAADTVRDAGLEFSSRRQDLGDGIEMTGETFNEDMPEVSLAPSMTFAPMERQKLVMDFAEEIGDEDGDEEEDGE